SIMQVFGLIKYEHASVRIVDNRSVQAMRQRQQKLRRRKLFAIAGKDEFFGKVLRKNLFFPLLFCSLSPLPHHFASHKKFLHRKNIDMLHRTARALVVEIEFTQRIDAITEKFDSDWASH